MSATTSHGDGPVRAFLSYHFDDEPFVQRVDAFLRRQPGIDPYCYGVDKRSDSWIEQIGPALAASDLFVLFVGPLIGEVQSREAKQAERRTDLRRIVVRLPGAAAIPAELFSFLECDPIREPATPLDCASEIVRRSGRLWVFEDDLPVGYPFDYEKDVIEAYSAGEGSLGGEYVVLGCAPDWPDVKRWPATLPNPVPKEFIGARRTETARVLVDARAPAADQETSPGGGSPNVPPLTLPEAGPRELLRYPLSGSLTVGILVSGGIAPGINSVIASIVERHELYQREHENAQRSKGLIGYNLRVLGYRDGFAALLRAGQNYTELRYETVREYANTGGALLGTSRVWELLESHEAGRDPEPRDRLLRFIVNKLTADGVDILYVIGGDGSMRAAHAIWTRAKRMKKLNEVANHISVVAVPATMDNDILWMWQSFGFLSAVEEANEAILKLHTEARSNPRLCVLQLFGSDSGFVVSHAALASGVIDAALIPEVEFSMTSLSAYVQKRLQERYHPGGGGQSPYGMILMAEAAIPIDAASFLNDEDVKLDEPEKAAIRNFDAGGRRVQGQIPDELRVAGLKIVSRVLQREIRNMPDPYWQQYCVFTNEPRQLIRAIRPSVLDVISGHRLGALGVDNAMAGYTDFMISQWLTEYVLVPLKLVVLGRKRVPQEGIFWKSVLANTGQPAGMA